MATQTVGSKDDRILLLICKTCKTVEEIYFDTSKPYVQDGETKYDQRDNPFLHEAVAPHERKNCLGLLSDVDRQFWLSAKGREASIEGIKKQLLDGSGSEGLAALQNDIYDIKANFSMDAMRCYSLHNRPQGQCSDYKSESRVIKPKTDAERKEAGLAKTNVKAYLCDFCPVKSFNQKKVYESRGLYK